MHAFFVLSEKNRMESVFLNEKGYSRTTATLDAGTSSRIKR
jgi:hypothetical protein